MKWLYKYPQRAYPYQQLIEENAAGTAGPGVRAPRHRHLRRRPLFRRLRRVRQGVSPRTSCIRVTVDNRGPEPAPIHVLPHLWFRNTWSWGEPPGPEPVDRAGSDRATAMSVSWPTTGRATPLAQPAVRLPPGPALPLRRGRRRRCCSRTTRRTPPRVCGPGAQSREPYVKDAFHRYVVDGERRVNPARRGDESRALHYRDVVPAGGSVDAPPAPHAGDRCDAAAARRGCDRRAAPGRGGRVLRRRSTPRGHARREARAAPGLRRACCGRSRSTCSTCNQWLDGDNPTAAAARVTALSSATATGGTSTRCASCPCRTSGSIPWFAAWDLAFHALPLALVDPEFAKEQLWLLLFEQFQHPSGRSRPTSGSSPTSIRPSTPGRSGASTTWTASGPARPTASSSKVLPQAADQLRLVGEQGRPRRGTTSSRAAFSVSTTSRSSTAASRCPRARCSSSPTPRAGWAMFCLNLMRIALELAKENQAYEGLATKFFQHYIYVGAAMKNMGGRRLPALGRGGRLLLRRPALSRRQLREVPRALAGRADPPLRDRAPGRTLDRVLSRVPRESRLVPATTRRTSSQTSAFRSISDGERATSRRSSTTSR